MSLIAVPLVQSTLLPNAAAAQYTCPPNTRVIVRHVVFTNTDSASRIVTTYLVPQGGSPGIANMVIDAQSIASKAAYVSSELSGLVLNAGDSLQSFADTAALVAMNAAGIQQT